jgi:hypothetical protein
LRLLLTKGRGALARVEGEGISLRHKGRRDVPPMFAMKKFRFEVDLGTLFETPKTVQWVWLEGMEISIPPKGERPKLREGPAGPRLGAHQRGDHPGCQAGDSAQGQKEGPARVRHP